MAREYREIRGGELVVEDLCDRPVAVLGDENVYPCKLPEGHEGQCVADTDAAT